MPLLFSLPPQHKLEYRDCDQRNSNPSKLDTYTEKNPVQFLAAIYMLAGLKHTEIKSNLIPRVEDNRPNSARDVVERCCIAVAENGWEKLDGEVANRDI